MPLYTEIMFIIVFTSTAAGDLKIEPGYGLSSKIYGTRKCHFTPLFEVYR